MGPADLYGLCWVEAVTEPNKFSMGWLRIVYHLMRPDRTPWHTWRIPPHTAQTNSLYLPAEKEDQRKVRSMLKDLIFRLDAAVRNAPARNPAWGYIDTDPPRNEVARQTAEAFRSFETEWDEMMNQPL